MCVKETGNLHPSDEVGDYPFRWVWRASTVNYITSALPCSLFIKYPLNEQ